MNDKFTEAIDRAKSYVSKLAEEENNLPSNIDLNKIWQLNSRSVSYTHLTLPTIYSV